MSNPGFDVVSKTLEDLEWPRILKALADRCTGGAAQDMALKLPFLDDEAALDQLQEIRELGNLVDQGETLPDAGVDPMDQVFERLKAKGILTALELLAVARLCRIFSKAFSFFSRMRRNAPRIAALLFVEAGGADIAASLKRLEAEISSCFEPDGTLGDLASTVLGKLRSEAKAARERLIARLDRLMDRHADLLQDKFYTQRDGRYVLPVRSDSHERLPGIVHGTSSSGATVFLEPKAAVNLGNALRLAELEVEREEERILNELSSAAADEADNLILVHRVLGRLDLLSAMARLTLELCASVPAILEPGTLDIKKARHPLFLLDGVDVIPSDIAISAGRALVISGPNAGGKTVALKTAGILSLMARAGLPIPAAPESGIGLQSGVDTDIGDDQSISRNLSTFSAHMTNLSGILSRAGAGSLVLLDELAVGTDPMQGAALAESILEAIVERGASVIVTTHYDSLKALAAQDARFENASVSLNLDTLAPTFVLHHGVPGTSSALEMASRFGVPGPVIRRARDLCEGEGAGRFAATLENIASVQRRFEEAEESARRAGQQAEAKAADLERTIQKMKERGQKAIDEESTEVLVELRRAREEIREASRRVKRRIVTSEDTEQARKKIETVGERLAPQGDLQASIKKPEAMPGRPASFGDLRPGLAIWVLPYRSCGAVVEVKSGKDVLVAVGSIKTRVPVDRIRVLEDAPIDREARPAGPRLGIDAAADKELPFMTSENTCDLRGLRVHEALEKAEKFLDDSLRAEREVAFFIHGFGTGAIQNGLREYLARSRYVSRFRPGSREEGGEGVTVTWLR